MEKKLKYWCAVIEYPDKKRILFGSILMDVNALFDEIEKVMYQKILESLPECFKIVELKPGIIWFASE
jgi:hypothetical protein